LYVCMCIQQNTATTDALLKKKIKLGKKIRCSVSTKALSETSNQFNVNVGGIKTIYRKK